MEQQLEECVRLRNEYNHMLAYYNETNEPLPHEVHHVYDNFAPLDPVMEVNDSIICDNLLAKETILVQKVIECANLLQQSEEDVRNRLKIWKEKQMRAQIGYPCSDKDTELAKTEKDTELANTEQDTELATIDSEFGTLFDCISKLLELANGLVIMLTQSMGMPENAQNCSITQLNEVNSQLNLLYRALLHQVLVVNEQPEPVLKTQRKLSKMEIRFLGAKKLGMERESNMPSVHFKITTEELVKQHTDGNMIEEVGIIENAEGKFAVNAKQQITVEFSKSKLISVKPRTNCSSKESQKTKKEQKYVLFFYSDPLNLKSFGQVNLWALSLPIMVGVNVSQDCELYATVFWQRAFGCVDCHGHIEDEPQSVTWPKLAEAIKYQFQSFTGATHLLTRSDTDFIVQKMFGPALINDPIKQGTLIEREKFLKEHMEDVQFSCWDWFYSITQLIKHKEVLDFWNKGWLIGFISYDDATQRTMKARSPTFLLRFSEGTRGALSIAGVVDTVTPDRQRVVRQPFHLSPMGISDLKKMSLVERLQVNQDLHNMYLEVSEVREVREVTKASILAPFGVPAPVIAPPSRRPYLLTKPALSISWPTPNRLFHMDPVDSDCSKMEVEAH
uniref:STAT transcription factor DNA-binding domain-containing protein n=1 Tax=Plectus sambesii TaxID=2011161 RepID=A0A914W7A7_9BILA